MPRQYLDRPVQRNRIDDPFAWIVLHFAMARRALAHIAHRGRESSHFRKLTRRLGKTAESGRRREKRQCGCPNTSRVVRGGIVLTGRTRSEPFHEASPLQIFTG